MTVLAAAALRFSNYSRCDGDRLVRVLDGQPASAAAREADRAMRSFLHSDRSSCVAAKASVATGGYRFGHYPLFDAGDCVEGLARDLGAFVAERPAIEARYATFVATFQGPVPADEASFERTLWAILQRLHELDACANDWDPDVSSSPDDARFGFSFAGHAFFVVGLHPLSARISRRFVMPALAFNLHAQFREARRTGDFERIVTAVRRRELALQGSINPELTEFGKRSEARQYSGRTTEDGWRCPFQPRSAS
jgi:FPC/CPF motif-containing protein YcgG